MALNYLINPFKIPKTLVVKINYVLYQLLKFN